ncbi:hypothetical protein [Spirosoma sp.]|uniref:hypothetical protein n=1 Tax=Spirosoma sp. TaxID=1899569 RepID=UPI003B3A2DDA
MKERFTDRRFSAPLWFLFPVVFLIAFGFALYTNHAWEDWYITFRASKNLAMGNGLVFTPGEHLHTFTSPLGTLIPALLSYLAGPDNDDLVLWLFRIVSAGLLGIAAVLLLKSALYALRSTPAIVMLLALVAIDAKTVDYSINGMETAFMVFFLALLVCAFYSPVDRPTYWLAVAIAGLMWSRPDSFVYVGAVMAGHVVFNPESRLAHTRASWISLFIRAGLLGFVFYLPWVLWAWWYYGTPIPNTITAKGLGSFDVLSLLQAFFLFPVTSLFSIDNSLHATFAPAYMSFGGWNLIIPLLSKALTFISISYWLLPSGRSAVRSWSFAAFLAQFYLSHVIPTPYPWYVPSVTFLCTWALSFELDHLTDWLSQKRPALLPMLKGTTGAIIAFQLAVFLCVAYQMRLQQQLIELDNRKAIGLWLRDHAKPGSTVFLECLGYIGFYSNLKMYDYPGLSSKEVVNARKVLHSNDFNKLVPYLKPDYLVLRPTDGVNASVLSHYQELKRFDVTERVRSIPFLPGRGYLQFDQLFTVYTRKPESQTTLTLN